MTIRKFVSGWADGKIWWWYILPWIFFATLFIDMLNNEPQSGTQGPFEFVLGFVFFGVHEVAHVVTEAILPDLLVSMAGSFSELLLAWLFVIAAFTKRAYFAAAMLLIIVTFASLSAGNYMADARAREFRLVSVNSAVTGDTSQNIHDWEFAFTELGILEHDTKIGWLVKAGGVSLGSLGLIAGLWLMYSIARPTEETVDVIEMDISADEKEIPKAQVVFGNDPKFLQKEAEESDSELGN